ncbi:MAG: hypothetical protein NZT92_23145, partial [Abditibacteriales bacterium]|nr:hypothetical protein [Abditibacteriales bacterium]MDW8368182.1 hypothetical protein [Abditibacteriales bacterium]
MRSNNQKVRKTNRKSSTGGTVKRSKVTFSLYAPEAREVLLLGDFSHWTEKPVSLKKHKDGLWKTTL